MSASVAIARLDTRLDPVIDPAWGELLDRCDGVEIFHHPLWLELLRDEYGYRIAAFCLRDPDGRIEAALPFARIESRLTGKRLVAVPFSDTCAPLIARDAGAGAGAALGEALSLPSERDDLPLTVHAPLEGVSGLRHPLGFVRHELALEGSPEEVAAGFSKATRRNLGKAEKAGLSFEIGRDRAALDDFFRLHLMTRRKLGVPTQPRGFIRRFEHLFDAGLGFVGTVREEGESIAAGVFLDYAGTLTYKYGASDPRRLGNRPNHLLHARAIRHAVETGARRYDFGRSDLDAEGLRRFKRGWGATEIDLRYTYLGTPVPAPDQSDGDGLSATVIRHSPVFVGRLAGQLLYRHYGR